MKNNVAQFLSYVLHPLLMPTYLLGILFGWAPDVFASEIVMAGPRILMVVFVTTFVVPAVCIASMKFSGMISSFTMEDRNERLLPFVFTTLFYLITCFLFIYKLNIGGTLSLVLLAITFVIAMVAAGTFFIKLSAHAAGLSGATGIICYLKITYPQESVMLLIVGLVLLWGAIVSARLQLGVHSPKEMYFGTAIGFITGFGSMIVSPILFN